MQLFAGKIVKSRRQDQTLKLDSSGTSPYMEVKGQVIKLRGRANEQPVTLCRGLLLAATTLSVSHLLRFHNRSSVWENKAMTDFIISL